MINRPLLPSVYLCNTFKEGVAKKESPSVILSEGGATCILEVSRLFWDSRTYFPDSREKPYSVNVKIRQNPNKSR